MNHNDKIDLSEQSHWIAFTQSFEQQNLRFTDTIRIHNKPSTPSQIHDLLPRVSLYTPKEFISEHQKTLTEQAPIQSSLKEPVEFRLGDLLAQGGMGKICQAFQVPLHRDVVIKMLREDKRNAQMAGRLLQEALLTGGLEHPNIVPIYHLGRNESNEPMLVMKRIEGVTWHEVLQKRKEQPDSLPQEQRDLDWHLRVFLQVCNALEFAHSKLIVHRDLKPENVMIGEFGEVYVLDWGIALSLNEDESRPLPTAKEAASMTGTPAYMAPEMLMDNLEALDQRTDIYLLGSVLHELLTGYPPHRGNTIMELLGQIYTRGEFRYPKEIPFELAEICNKAMQLEQENRFQTVRELRRAIEQFLTHRESYELVQEGQKLIQQLQGLLSENASQEALPQQEEVMAEINSVFWKCQFGLKQALRIWSKNQEAQQSLQQLLEMMIQFELDQNDFKAAEKFFSDLPFPNQELASKLQKLKEHQEQKAEEFKEFEQIQFERDAEISAKARRLFLWTCYSIISIACLVVHFLGVYDLYQASHWGFITSYVSSIAFSSLMIYLFRDSLFKNTYNRQMLMYLLFAFFSLTLLRLVYIWTNLSVAFSSGIDLIVLHCFSGGFAILVESKIAVTAIGYLITGFAGMLFPSHFLIFVGIGHIIAMFNITKTWNYREKAGM